MGVRGNREYLGADPRATPHVWTNVARCRRCDFFYTDPAIAGLEHLEETFYGDPERYSAHEGAPAAEVIRKRLAWLGSASGSLLDVGAGKGEFVREARNAGWAATGVEPSAGFCKYAQERLGIELVHGYLGSEVAVPTASFDVASLNHVLEHVPEPVNLLQRVRTYLKPGGRLFVEVPNCDSHFLRAADAYFRVRGLAWSSRLSPLHPPFHRFGFTRRSLRYAAEQAGYRVVAERTFGGADRGYRNRAGWPMNVLRSGVSSILSLVGNRELLGLIATRP